LAHSGPTAGVLVRRLVAATGVFWVLAWLSAAERPRIETPPTTDRMDGGPAATPRSSETAAGARVQTEMHNVDLEIDSGITLRIRRLDGELVPTGPESGPSLDDKHSYVLSLRSAEIALDMASLGALLNDHVFGYSASPIRQLRISIEDGQLIQRGVLSRDAGLPFEIRATPALTADGQIRLHATSIKVMGVKAGGLMKVFGMHLEGLVRLTPGHGARIEGDDIVLDPTGMLPLPAFRGRLSSIRIENGLVVQTFGPPAPAGDGPEKGTRTRAANYIRFKGGTLRFGRLTMTDAWLEIDDSDPGDPFAFSLDRYNDQLVAGYSQTTVDQGLVVHMPDLGRLHPAITVPRSDAVGH
jgi:hypothetical protein